SRSRCRDSTAWRRSDVEGIAEPDASAEKVARGAAGEAGADAEAAGRSADLGMLQVGEVAALLLVAADVLAAFLREDLLGEHLPDRRIVNLELGGVGRGSEAERQENRAAHISSRHSAISFSLITPSLTSRQFISVAS